MHRRHSHALLPGGVEEGVCGHRLSYTPRRNKRNCVVPDGLHFCEREGLSSVDTVSQMGLRTRYAYRFEIFGAVIEVTYPVPAPIPTPSLLRRLVVDFIVQLPLQRFEHVTLIVEFHMCAKALLCRKRAATTRGVHAFWGVNSTNMCLKGSPSRKVCRGLARCSGALAVCACITFFCEVSFGSV